MIRKTSAVLFYGARQVGTTTAAETFHANVGGTLISCADCLSITEALHRGIDRAIDHRLESIIGDGDGGIKAPIIFDVGSMGPSLNMYEKNAFLIKMAERDVTLVHIRSDKLPETAPLDDLPADYRITNNRKEVSLEEFKRMVTDQVCLRRW